jgi:4-amino-4-deoxychorismate mutase
MSNKDNQEADASVLGRCRLRIDQLDEAILELLGERFDVARAVAEFKRDEAIPMMQSDRVAVVRARYLNHGIYVNLPPGFSSELCELIVKATCDMEDEIIDAPVPPSQPSPS